MNNPTYTDKELRGFYDICKGLEFVAQVVNSRLCAV